MSDRFAPPSVQLAQVEAEKTLALAQVEAQKQAAIASSKFEADRLSAEAALVRTRAENVDVGMMLISEKAKADLALAHARNKTIITICGMLFAGLATTVLGVSCMLF